MKESSKIASKQFLTSSTSIPFLPTRGEDQFPSSSIWAGLVTFCDQQNVKVRPDGFCFHALSFLSHHVRIPGYPDGERDIRRVPRDTTGKERPHREELRYPIQ